MGEGEKNGGGRGGKRAGEGVGECGGKGRARMGKLVGTGGERCDGKRFRGHGTDESMIDKHQLNDPLPPHAR